MQSCLIIYFFISPGEHCLRLLAHQTETCIFHFLHCIANLLQRLNIVFLFFNCYRKKQGSTSPRAVACASDLSVEPAFFIHILHHHNLKQSHCLVRPESQFLPRVIPQQVQCNLVKEQYMKGRLSRQKFY